MAQTHSQSIPREQFLTLCANLLHRTFVDATRTDAKQVYRELAAGRVAPLSTVRMEDQSTVRFDLALDHSEFGGKLNYGAFRASVLTLIGNVAEVLREKRPVNVFNAHDDAGRIVFAVSAVTLEAQRPNVMVLGADLASGDAAVTLRLMYLDPEQFAQAQAAEPA
ncbi:MAG: hypothetical protein KDI01_08675 [Halioglobus sp.]|nr:hypothetical protein [Halioglobus sp.]